MKKEELISLIYEWQTVVLNRKGVTRETEKKILAVLGSKPIKIITGFRRSGKSFLVQQIIQKGIKNGLFEKDNFLYINFEDYRLDEYTTNKHLEKIYRVFKENICTPKGRKIIVFDEIQKIKNWDKFICTLYEKETNLELIITGSNSEMLSSELSSKLSGRFIEFSITPFSFREYLLYHSITCDNRKEYLRNKDKINKAFYDFLCFGGLPETFEINTPEAKLSYCYGIITKIILDDVVKRFKVDNVELLEKIYRYLTAESGKLISFQNICNYAIQLGHNTKLETVIKYVGYLQKAFALFEVNKFDWSQKKVFAGQKKYYSIDTGLISVFRKITENYSFRLENIVALELYRRNKNLYFGRNYQGKEIDFIVSENDQWNKFQVCAELTDQNIDRETSVFGLSDKYLSGSNYLLTLDDFKKNIPAVIHENLIEWLLGF
ncbi:MAG: hypothetical protein A2309_04940 [Bacteroidetes bacterium RIFOXYB2_FULL_35_7]|nr:MAG: hypothetical protein A2X01_00915 [Bacteroidetes bacterium GWF2_35_48]OFY97184.1 MAG: hypothetical protein A2309_04940 [Bacteroidetes bacterium RIFOXYB2_FULL_35_7]HBX53513.1 hypothetical protein [Bacteroidales bacterium]